MQDEIWEFQVLSGTSGGKGRLHVKPLNHHVFAVLLAMKNLLTNLNLGCLGWFMMEVSQSAGGHRESLCEGDHNPIASSCCDCSALNSEAESCGRRLAKGVGRKGFP